MNWNAHSVAKRVDFLFKNKEKQVIGTVDYAQRYIFMLYTNAEECQVYVIAYFQSYPS